MNDLRDFLAGRVGEFLRRQSGDAAVPSPDDGVGKDRTRGAGGRRPARDSRDPADVALIIAERLVHESYANGLLLDNVTVVPDTLPDGNTAEAVLRLEVSVPFVFKLSGARKLVDEASLLRRVHERRDLPESFRQRYPKVYALKSDQAPYAYLMQYFDIQNEYTALHKLLHPEDGASSASGRRLAHAVADALMEGFTSTLNKRYRPSLQEDYLSRIEGRMKSAQGMNDAFRPRHLVIGPGGSTRLSPWTEYVERLRRLTGGLDRMQAPFATFVHGDPNPENILVGGSPAAVDVRFIDPKEWEYGDWLFDVTKVTHYLAVTRPAELTEDGDVRIQDSPDGLIIDYDLKASEQSRRFIEELDDRAQEFALKHGDYGWRHRYAFGMAANLLGLPANRLEKRPDVAYVLYAEGVRWLAECVEGLEQEAGLVA